MTVIDGTKQTVARSPSDGKALRTLMTHFPTGVVIVSSHVEGTDYGMTVNSLTSVSLEPPLVAVCAAHSSHTGAAIRTSGGFGITLLTHDHLDIAKRLAATSVDPFAGIEIDRTRRGYPYLASGVGFMECEVMTELEAGDHRIIVGRVSEIAVNGGNPLVFFKSKLGTLAGLGALNQLGPPQPISP